MTSAVTQQLLMSYGKPAASITYNNQSTQTSGASTYTFTNFSIGAAAFNRLVVVGVLYTSTAGAPTVTSVTVGGNAATQIGTPSGTTNFYAALYTIRVDAGTTATIVVAANVTGIDCSIATWSCYDLLSQTAVDTGLSVANPGSDSLTTSNGGVAIAFASNGGTPATYVWSGLTENFDFTSSDNAASWSGASANISSGSNLSVTATRTGGSTQPKMLTASFR